MLKSDTDLDALAYGNPTEELSDLHAAESVVGRTSATAYRFVELDRQRRHEVVVFAGRHALGERLEHSFESSPRALSALAPFDSFSS